MIEKINDLDLLKGRSTSKSEKSFAADYIRINIYQRNIYILFTVQTTNLDEYMLSLLYVDK